MKLLTSNRELEVGGIFIVSMNDDISFGRTVAIVIKLPVIYYCKGRNVIPVPFLALCPSRGHPIKIL